MRLTRREAIKVGVFGAGTLALPAGRLLSAGTLNRMAASALPAPYSVPLTIPPVLAPVRSTATTDYFQITMQARALEILPGYATTMLCYDGMVPGPTIQVERGRKSVVRFINAMPAKHPTFGYQPNSSVHLHGSASLPQYDGYANDICRPGQYKDYQYPNMQESRNLWYHDHAAHRTAQNVYSGLAGFYLIRDSLEYSLPLPRYRYDVPLMVTDAMFTNTGQLLWNDDHRLGMNGDVILVNGRPWPVLQVERRKYRFRILVAAASRDFRWKLDTGEPFVVVGTDAGLLHYPQAVKSFRHGNAERYDVIVDFAKYQVGQRVQLLNLSNPNNVDEANTDKVMAFDVVSDATSTDYNAIPDVMNAVEPTMQLQPTPTMTTRIIDLARADGEWRINGLAWEDVEASRYTATLADVPLGATEIWELRNDSGGWHHPLHVHLIDMKILDRRVKLGPAVAPMPHEQGPKDVIYLGENERVRVIANFAPHSGRYMIHCHNLVHEDHSMMGQFRIVGPTDPDPITTARPRNLPAPPL